MNRQQLTTLVKVLAAQDALWTPLRRWSGDVGAVVAERRALYASAGVPWHSGERDKAGQMSASRVLSGLEEAGLVTVPGAGRAASVRLTDPGEALARALVGMPSIAESAEAVAELQAVLRRRAAEAPKHCGVAWCPETWLAGVAWGAQGQAAAFVCAAERFLPALARGWAASGADVEGRAYYRPAAAVPKGHAPPAADADYDEGLDDAYIDAFKDARHELATAAPTTAGELGIMPLGSSMGGNPNP